jgi:2OG-Fe(II) oxygenase superfamily
MTTSCSTMATERGTSIDGCHRIWRRVSRRDWEPVGVHERLRLYRYDVEQKFDWHPDGCFATGDRSFFASMVYLNENVEGGTTSFTIDRSSASTGGVVRVTPKTGMALLFHPPILHRADPITAGRRYVLQTDVMYGRVVEIDA